MSVPSGCPGEPGGRLDSRMSPPTGDGRGSTYGPTKQMSSSRITNPAGIHTTRRRRTAAHAIPREAMSMGVSAATVVAGSATAIADPRVQDGVHDVDEEIGEHGH